MCFPYVLFLPWIAGVLLITSSVSCGTPFLDAHIHTQTFFNDEPAVSKSLSGYTTRTALLQWLKDIDGGREKVKGR